MIYPRDIMEFNEKGTTKISSIFCDVKDNNFSFKFPYMQDQRIIIRWQSNEIGILERQFNLTNAMRYFSHFKNKIHLSILSFNGFDLNILNIAIVI